MFHKVLVPLDGSDLAEQILPYVSSLCRQLDIPALLLKVVEPGSLDIPEGPDDLVGPWEAKAQMRISELAADLRSEGVKADAIVSHGRAQNQILGVAADEGCDLIAMSTKGRGLLGWAMIGSVAYNVVHSSTVPVLTIAPEKLQNISETGARFSRIPVPLDGSENAESALPYAEFLADKLSSQIMLIRAIPDAEDYSPFLSYPQTARLRRETRKNAESYLQNIASDLRRKGLSAEWRLIEGSAGPSIVEVARESTDDLVVMTTRGRSGIIPGILGSTAISVLRNSGDPVLVIPPRADNNQSKT